MIKYGRFNSAPVGAVAFMPPFRDVLEDRDIIAAAAFIKARWPTALRLSQAMLNPGRAGTPQRADQTEWRFPPRSCSAARRQQAVTGAVTATDAEAAKRDRSRFAQADPNSFSQPAR